MDDKRMKYPLELIKTGVLFLHNARLKRNVQEDPFRSMVGYCLQYMQNGKWLPLNRDYKPIGLSADKGWAKYEDYSYLFIDGKDINFNILWDNQPNFFTYSDGSSPRDAKGIQRYSRIIKTAFLDHYDICFTEAWQYKTGISDESRKYYAYNLSRFK
jgi:hypothetical protein